MWGDYHLLELANLVKTVAQRRELPGVFLKLENVALGIVAIAGSVNTENICLFF